MFHLIVRATEIRTTAAAPDVVSSMSSATPSPPGNEGSGSHDDAQAVSLLALCSDDRLPSQRIPL
jgi:hypothetical protein